MDWLIIILLFAFIAWAGYRMLSFWFPNKKKTKEVLMVPQKHVTEVKAEEVKEAPVTINNTLHITVINFHSN